MGIEIIVHKCAETAERYGINFDKLIFIAKKIKKETKESSDILANSLKVILTRINRDDGIKNIKNDLEGFQRMIFESIRLNLNKQR